MPKKTNLTIMQRIQQGAEPMSLLSDQQKRFVRRYVNLGGHAIKGASHQAARDAGYAESVVSDVTVVLLAKPHVLEAIRQESIRVLLTAAPMGVNLLLDLAQRLQAGDLADPKLQLKVAERLIQLADMEPGTKQRVEVKHDHKHSVETRSPSEIRDRAVELLMDKGFDEREATGMVALLENKAGAMVGEPTFDAEFEIIADGDVYPATDPAAETRDNSADVSDLPDF